MENKNKASVKHPVIDPNRGQIRHDGYFSYQPTPEKPKSPNTVKTKFNTKKR